MPQFFGTTEIEIQKWGININKYTSAENNKIITLRTINYKYKEYKVVS